MEDVSFESTCSMTQQDFASFVEEHEKWGDPNHYELLNGRVVMNPPAGWPHGEFEVLIGRLLLDFVRSRGLGRVFGSSQGFELPSGDTLEPDLSYISQERWSAAPAPKPGKFLRIAPDLVVEILSVGTQSRDRSEKKGIYARNGVGEYWIVDSRARGVTRFFLDGDRYDAGRVFTEEDRFASVVLPGLEFAVAEIFPEER